MLRTPGGSPASAKISPHISPPTYGESSEGLSTTALPRTSGAVIERAERISAAFQGAIAPTTPTGRRIPIANAPVSDGMISPIDAYAVPAAWRNSPATKWSWNMPKPKVAPVSRASSETTSSPLLSRASAALRKTCCRVAGGAVDHSGNAAAEASTAFRASSRVPAATRPTVSPVNGSRSSNVSPPDDGTHSPAMNC